MYGRNRYLVQDFTRSYTQQRSHPDGGPVLQNSDKTGIQPFKYPFPAFKTSPDL